MKKIELRQIPVKSIVILRRNPQYLTEKQMENLKASIKRDGFVAPILVRPLSKGRYEAVSGNHRFMAARELKMETVPAVVSRMDVKAAKRLAVNLNTIHGEPNAELLAPFLAEMDDDLLKEIHLEHDLIVELTEFDAELEARLKELAAPDFMNRESLTHENKPCECPKCGRKHLAKM